MRRDRQAPGNQRGIGGRQDDDRQRRAPVAHPHPVISSQPVPARPAGPVPAGERDPGHPARLLAHRGVDPVREERAHRDQRTLVVAHPCERGAATQFGDAQAQFVILGQAAGVERRAAAQLGDRRQHRHRDRAPGPRQRHARPQRGPDDDAFPVMLGEFVRIMARYQPRGAVDQRDDGQLHDAVVGDQRGEDGQLVAVDHILRIVQHDRGRRSAGACIVAPQRRP